MLNVVLMLLAIVGVWMFLIYCMEEPRRGPPPYL